MDVTCCHYAGMLFRARFFTGVAIIRHAQILRAGPVYQVEVEVAQIKLGQAAESCFPGPLALVFGTQFTAGRLLSLMKQLQETQTGGHVPPYLVIKTSSRVKPYFGRSFFRAWPKSNSLW